MKDLMKFETEEKLVDFIESMHLQNTNGRENELEMFRLGIEAALEEFKVLAESYATFCIECDRKYIKPLVLIDYLKL